MLEEKAYGYDLDDLRTKLGLTRPIYVQYLEWLRMPRSVTTRIPRRAVGRGAAEVAHEVTFVERFDQRPTWTAPAPLWPGRSLDARRPGL